MKEKGRHSSESGNPGCLKEARLPEITRYFSLKGPAWMDACPGMTNYDPVSWGDGRNEGEIVGLVMNFNVVRLKEGI